LYQGDQALTASLACAVHDSAGVWRLWSRFFDVPGPDPSAEFVLELVSVFHHDPEPDQAIRVNLNLASAD
jgi:hypothetical protein